MVWTCRHVKGVWAWAHIVAQLIMTARARKQTIDIFFAFRVFIHSHTDKHQQCYPYQFFYCLQQEIIQDSLVEEIIDSFVVLMLIIELLHQRTFSSSMGQMLL
jgi:hypothetical protein